MNYSEKMFVRSLTFCAKTSFEKNAWTFFLLFSWLISDISVKYDCTTYQLKFHLDPGRWFLTQYSTNYPAETRRKHTVSGRNLPENARNSMEKSGCRFCQVPACSRRNRRNPVTGSIHRNTASTFRRFPVFSSGIRPVLLDLGRLIAWPSSNTARHYRGRQLQLHIISSELR